AELETSTLLCFTGVSRDSADIIKVQQDNVEHGASVEIEAMHRVKAEAAHMKEALLRGDFDELAEAMRRGWEAKKGTARTVSNSVIEKLMEAALASGAKAGKVSGAGGGGFLILLVDPARRMEVQRALLRYGASVMGFQFSHQGMQGWDVDEAHHSK